LSECYVAGMDLFEMLKAEPIGKISKKVFTTSHKIVVELVLAVIFVQTLIG
jgi:hypothetical protein